jgi:L-threonylcarbamoyladenylate synthase
MHSKSHDSIQEAVSALAADHLVAMPTETVYGLAARIDRPIAIEKVFKTKGRPSFDPLIVHVATIDQARLLAGAWPKTAESLGAKLWPGPMTLVVPKNQNVSDLISSGLETVGLRVPKHPLALSLLTTCQVPLAAPSANRFGRTSPTTADHVRSEFPEAIKAGEILILDGGACDVGVESTVIRCEDHQVTILRPGGVSRFDIESALKSDGLQVPVLNAAENHKAASPGHTEHHYMPMKPLTVFWGTPEEIQKHQLQLDPKFQMLALSRDSRIAARELYAALRSADHAEGKTELILYRETGEGELWEAIDDRLKRAASHRLGAPPI